MENHYDKKIIDLYINSYKINHKYLIEDVNVHSTPFLQEIVGKFYKNCLVKIMDRSNNGEIVKIRTTNDLIHSICPVEGWIESKYLIDDEPEELIKQREEFSNRKPETTKIEWKYVEGKYANLYDWSEWKEEGDKRYRMRFLPDINIFSENNERTIEIEIDDNK